MKEVKVNAFEELAMDEMMAVDGGGNFETPLVKLLHFNYHRPYTRTVNRRGKTTVSYSGVKMGGNCVVCRYNAY